MFCPNCQAEYREGFTECSDCEVALVEVLPPEPEHPEGPFSTVFRSADTSLLPVIESLLDDADIPYLIQGEESAQGLFPLGSLGGGSDGRLVGAVVKVPQEYEAEAAALLAEIEEPSEAADTEEE
ncbi:MAG: DUF2007 domain-containing protein [Acidobacteriota bacterium]|nr:DUF2007 domain-containing protein [Acidobacteriota bacterium]